MNRKWNCIIIIFFTLKAFPYTFPLWTKEQNKFVNAIQSKLCFPPLINHTVIKYPMEEKMKKKSHNSSQVYKWNKIKSNNAN